MWIWGYGGTVAAVNYTRGASLGGGYWRLHGTNAALVCSNWVTTAGRQASQLGSEHAWLEAVFSFIYDS